MMDRSRANLPARASGATKSGAWSTQRTRTIPARIKDEVGVGRAWTWAALRVEGAGAEFRGEALIPRAGRRRRRARVGEVGAIAVTPQQRQLESCAVARVEPLELRLGAGNGSQTGCTPSVRGQSDPTTGSGLTTASGQ
jgi:hypothetical protein